MESKITVIRHAPTEYNKQNIFMGTLDIPVEFFNPIEIEKLKNFVLKKQYTAIYSSPLKRALQTAKMTVGEENNIIIDNRIIERNLGILQGQKKEEVRKINDKLFNGTVLDFYYTPKNGEDFRTMILRVNSFLCDYCHDGNNILVFTHNGVYHIIKSLLTGITLNSAFSIKEPFLEPQVFIVDDKLYSKIKRNPFYTIDKNINL